MDQKLPAIASADDKVPAAAAATATTSTTSDGQPSQLHPFACSTRGRTLVSQVTVGSYVSVYWPLDEIFYPARVVGAATAASSFTVAYTDNSVETLNLHQEKFRLLDDESEFVEEERNGASSPSRPGKVAAASLTSALNVHDGGNKHNQRIGSRYDAKVPKFSASSSELSDDVYLLILSCLTSLKDVSALSRTCRRTHFLWKQQMHRERLLRSLFRSRFGSNANACTFHGVLDPMNWEEVWRNMVDLKQALMLQQNPDFAREGFNKRTKEQMCQLIRAFTGGDDDEEDEVEEDKKLPASTGHTSTTGIKRKRTKADRLRRTIGVLSEREESEAIFYDNPSFAPEASVARYCFGYFGMTSLSVSRPTASAEVSCGPPVAVWGDFPGCRIFHSPADVLYDRDTSPVSSRRGKRGEGYLQRFEAIATSNGEGLVLSALVCPFGSGLATIEIEGNALRPVLFLGMSSGTVVSVGVGPGTNGGRESYGILSSEESHVSEVTSLTLVKNPAKIDGGGSPESYFLASGSVDKQIRIYPSAFVADSSYSLGKSYAVCLSESLMFCLAATTVQHLGLNSALLSAGDDKGFISFYASETDESKDQDLAFYSAGKSKFSTREQIKPTRMKFLDDDVLLAGSTHGDVKVLRLRVREDLVRSTRVIASVVTLHRMSSAHIGTIEQIERFGDVLITSGGFDGQLKGWNYRTGRLLGSITCHPGRHSAPETAPVQPNRPIFSSVVGSVMLDDYTDGKSLLCLCRDGTLFNWKYTQDVEKHESRSSDTLDSSGATANDWFSKFLRPAIKSAKVAGLKKQQKIRTLAELKQVMTKSGRASVALQQRMRLEIFKSAVAVALQPDHKDAPFRGADGKIYESSKKAFGKYSGLQACASCRSRAQGVSSMFCLPCWWRLGKVCITFLSLTTIYIYLFPVHLPFYWHLNSRRLSFAV